MHSSLCSFWNLSFLPYKIFILHLFGFILLRSESSGGMCAKLHTVEASNNRDHGLQSLYYCLFAPHIYGCCSLRTSCSWCITHSTQHQWRGCNSRLVLNATGTIKMVFMYKSNLINKSGTKSICCEMMALKFVNKNVW